MPTAARHRRRTSLFQRVRSLVPESVASALANCGGLNHDGRRFAAHLLDPDLTDDEYLAICHALIFANGVRKTTSYQRNVEVVRSVGAKGLLPRGARIRVLDVGASVGLDGLATYSFLRETCPVDEYHLGDLHTGVLYNRQRGLVFDEDGRLLQIKLGRSFVAVNFSYNYPFQRLTSLPKRLRPWLLGWRARSWSPGGPAHTLGEGGDVVRIPLVHPRLEIGAPTSPFRLRRMDVFAPIADNFDLIICMHLLVPRYFSEQRINEGTRNLSGALRPGGTLLAGATERFQVVRRLADGSLQTSTSFTQLPAGESTS